MPGLASGIAIPDNGGMEAREAHEEITLLLGDARRGSAHAQERLYSHVYRELHRLAERQLRGDREHGGATSLVHEAFFKLPDTHGVATYQPGPRESLPPQPCAAG